MPLLAGLLVTLASALADFFVKFVSGKMAIAAAAFTALGLITAALLLTFNTLVAPLAQSVFSSDVGQMLGLAFPPVSGNCMFVMGAVWSACTLYSWQAKCLAMFVEA
jgi:hypothetical protein